MRIPLLAFSALSGALLGQTTWTSFADRRGHMMAATPSQGVVMFGGQSVTTPGGILGDTNELSINNQTWTEGGIDGPSAPPPTSHGGMAATTIAGQATYVMFGGVTIGSVPVVAKTWRYDGTAWGDHTNGLQPGTRSRHAMVTDPTTNLVWMFGGIDGVTGLGLSEMWSFAPATDTWASMTVVGTPPSPRYGMSMAFDPGNGGTDGRIYVFGGSPFRNDLWEFDPYAQSWTQKIANGAPGSPPGRRQAAMTFLVGTGTILLFGGLGGSGTIYNDTWSYDRATNAWTPQLLGTPPPPRYEHGLTADSLGDNLILIGGTDSLTGTGGVLEGTWKWSSLTSMWTEEIRVPNPRDGAAMAYDSARNRHVVFGGRAVPSGAALDETWEIDGLNWRQRLPSPKPSPRSDAGMSFDEARSVTVLFGGWTNGPCSTPLADTWIWNGNTWLQMSPASSPPADGSMQLVYDSKRGLVWSLVGTNPGNNHMHMWSWNGSTWIPDPTMRPGGLSAAFDTVRGELVALLDPYPNDVGRTFLWNGTGWRRPSASPEPAPRAGHRLVWDAARQNVVLYGGYSGTTVFADTWSWDGLVWQQRSVTGPLAGATGHAMIYDSVRQRVVLFGGANNLVPNPSGISQTWEWDGVAWTQPSTITISPTPRWNAACAYDPLRGRMVLLCGEQAGFAYLAETWEFDGIDWVNRTPAAPVPPARAEARACFDAASGRIIMFGGVIQGQSVADTWSWNGTTWAQENPPAIPPGRFACHMESVAGQATMVGGVSLGPAAGRSDIWRWSAGNWTLVDPGQPQYRINYGAAYDARLDRLVVFGGRLTNTCSGAMTNETWEWDGDSWTQRFPANPPTARIGCRMTFDASRGRVVMYGGSNGAPLADTWEWDSELGVWLPRAPLVVPPANAGYGMAFDSAREVSVAFGSFGTWDYGAVNPGRTYPPAQTRLGCATSVSAGQNFRLRTLPWTGPWAGDAIEMEFDYAPPGLGLFLWGFSDFGTQPSIPLFLLGLNPNQTCLLHVPGDIIEVLPLSATRYTSSFVIPNVSAALGFKLYGQGAWFDLGAPTFPTVVTTNELVFEFGQK